MKMVRDLTKYGCECANLERVMGRNRDVVLRLA